MTTLIQASPAEHNAALDQIETLIDRFTLPGLLSLMAEVASAKADHYMSVAHSNAWDSAAAILLEAQDKTFKLVGGSQ